MADSNTDSIPYSMLAGRLAAPVSIVAAGVVALLKGFDIEIASDDVAAMIEAGFILYGCIIAPIVSKVTEKK